MAENLTRKKLYDLVWQKPMVDVAKEYGLSDRGLAKLCERNSIPVPPRGYWAKKAAGQDVKKPPLLELKDQTPETAILLRKAQPASRTINKKEEAAIPEPIQEAIDRENLAQHRIEVPTTMHNPHPIVATWKKVEEHEAELNKKYNNHWRLPITPLDRRRWKITSCLFKELEKRGFKIIEEGKYRHQKELWILCERDKVSFDISERIRKYRRELTPEEKKNRTYSQKWTQEREKTGKLEITLAPERNRHLEVKIQEDDDSPFENRLNEVVIKVIELMWSTKSSRLKSEEEEQQRYKAEEERRTRQELAKNEQKRKLNLEYKAQSWDRAQVIRKYITAVVEAHEKGQIQVDDTEFSTWRIWAESCADEIDFIKNGNPLIKLREDPEDLFDSNDQRSGYNSDFYSSYTPSRGHPWRKWYHK